MAPGQPPGRWRSDPRWESNQAVREPDGVGYDTRLLGVASKPCAERKVSHRIDAYLSE